MNESPPALERWQGLMRVLGRRGWSAAEINDWLWLARTLAVELPAPPLPKTDGSEQDHDKGEDGKTTLDPSGSDSVGNQQSRNTAGSPGTTTPPTSPTPSSREGALVAPITAENIDRAATPRVGIAETSLIRRPRKLGRALAPLNRWQEEGAPCLLDVAATVEAIASARSERMPWQPSLRPRRQPWLELQLVFDGSPSMALWQRLRKELPRLLSREVRWRDLRCWQLLTEPHGTVSLADLRGRPCAPRRLRQRTDRSLVLVVSDAVAPAWYQGAMAELLQSWAVVQPVALLQLLPQRLWMRTALAQQPAGWIRSASPMRPHGQLAWQPVEGGAPRPGQAGAAPWLTLPVLQLRSEFLGAWARMLVGSRQGSALAYRFALPQRHSPQPQEGDVDAEGAVAETEDLLAVFLFTASARARKLLALLTFAPVITLPIVRLLHGQMLGQLGEEGVAEQAEVLFSGLFAPATAPPQRPVPIDQQLLDFVAGDLRPRLREGLRVWEARAVFDRVQTYVIERLNLSQDQFEALLLSPEQCETHPDQNLLRAFAIAAPSCLRGLGGRYEALAERLEQCWRQEPVPAIPWLQGLEEQEVEFETALLIDAPPLQAIPFTTARFEELELRPIPFTTATLKSDRTIKVSPGTAWGFHVPLQRDHFPFAATADQSDSLALTLVEIPAGRFLMGSPPDESERSNDDGPQHEVELASFFISQTPITQGQWQEVAQWEPREGERWGRELKASPSRFQPKDAAEEEKEPYGSFHLLDGEASSDQRPVEQVSWLDAMEFCRRLSQRTRRVYTLPSEAQWEYACRAGTTTPFAFGETLSDELANYDASKTYGSGQKGAYRQQTTPVGMFPANAWGLEDMHGNVWEWCLDDWHESYVGAPSDGSPWLDGAEGKSSKSGEKSKLLRGGSWLYDPWDCRSAYRGRYRPVDAFITLGFRVVCLPQGPSLNA